MRLELHVARWLQVQSRAELLFLRVEGRPLLVVHEMVLACKLLILLWLLTQYLVSALDKALGLLPLLQSFGARLLVV